MEYKVYAIYDGKINAYMQPIMFCRTRGEAIRNFQTAVNDPKSTLNRYPEDYILFEVADFDDRSAEFNNITPIYNCGSAMEFLDRKMTEDNEEYIGSGR